MGIETILLNPLMFYPLVMLLGLIILSVIFPFIGLFFAGFVAKILLIIGVLIGAFLVMKNIMKGRVPVITGIAQIILILSLGLVMPNLLSKMGLQSIVVPTFSAMGSSFITLPFEIPSPSFWAIAIIGFLIFLESNRKIGRRL